MKKRTYLVFFNLFLCFFAFSKTTNLEEALQNKWVSSSVVMLKNEEIQRYGLRLSLKNLTNEKLIVTIPVGFVFQAQDSMVQDFIHVESRELIVPALSSSSMFLHASCIRANRFSPKNGDTFLATTLASPQLVALTTFAYERKLYKTSAMQSALWAISDNYDLVGIDNLELAKFVAQLCKKTLPDYFVHYKNNDTPGIIAQTALEPLAIKGLFQYTLPSDQQVKLDLVDVSGKSILEQFHFVQIMTQHKGRHKFTFSISLSGVTRGTYFVKMTTLNNETEFASKQVVF